MNVLPERDDATMVNVLVVPRAATDASAGGMLSSIGRFVFTMVAFDVHDA